MYLINKQKKKRFLPDIYAQGQKLKNVDECRQRVILKRCAMYQNIKILPSDIFRNSLTLKAFKKYFLSLYCMLVPVQQDFLKTYRLLHKQALKSLDRKSPQYHQCTILDKYKLFSFFGLILHSNVRLVHEIIHDAAHPLL